MGKPPGASPSAAVKYFSAKSILGAEEVDMQNPDMFKNAMIQKMTGSDAIMANDTFTKNSTPSESF